MRIGAIAEGPLERILLGAGLLPRPLVETILALILARALMAGVRHGVFDALARGPATAAAVARRLGLHPEATRALLGALDGAGYVRRHADGRWTIGVEARRWLVRGARRSVRDYVLFCHEEWRLLDGLDAFLTSGRAAAIHDPARTSAGFWESYVRGMRALARLAADEVAARVPLPRSARRLLDVGGAHGEYACAFRRRHPRLIAEVLDLEPAVRVARRLAEREGSGLRFRAGDARRAPLPPARYDACLVVNLLHHLGPDEARRLLEHLAPALAPGGVLVVADAFRTPDARRPSQLAALLGLHFRLTSDAPLPALGDVTRWLHDAGLTTLPPRSLRRAPGAVLVLGVRPPQDERVRRAEPARRPS